MLPSPRDPAFPATLTAVRTAQAMTVPALARILSVPTHTVAEWEQGGAAPTFRQWRRLNDMFASEAGNAPPREPDMDLYAMPLDLIVNELHRRGYAVTLLPLK